MLVTKKIMLGVIVAVANILPSTVFATTATFPFLSMFLLPAPASVYTYGADVHVTGSWQLPPDWAGNVYVYVDGKKVSDRHGVPYITFNTIGSAATTTGSFDFNIGGEGDGRHTMQLIFWGGERCAIDTLAGTGGASLCAVTDENFISNQAYPKREFVVGIPQSPRLEISPDVEMLFSKTTTERSFTLRNTGGKTLRGSVMVSGSAFACMEGCTYVIPASASAQVRLRFTGPADNTDRGVIGFLCGDDLDACAAPIVLRTLRTDPLHVRDVPAANETQANILPQVEARQHLETSLTRWIIPETEPVNLGDRRMIGVRVRNTGGGMLSGHVTGLSDHGFSCVRNCAYTDLTATSSDWIVTFRFDPKDDHRAVDTALFTDSSAPSDRTFLSMEGRGNARPIIRVSSSEIDLGDVPLGSTSHATVVVSNIGAAFFEQSIQFPPGAFACVFHCTLALSPGSSTPMVFSFSPDSSGSQSVQAIFPGFPPVKFLMQGKGIME